MANKILVIDYSLPLLRQVAEIMKEEGYEVTTFEGRHVTGEELNKIEPDIIITYVQQLLVGGYEVVSLIRSMDRLRKVPILALTSQQVLLEVSAALREANIYMTELCTVEKLLDVIEGMLPAKRLPTHRPSRNL